MKIEFSGQSFEKSAHVKFHENPSSGSWVVSCGQTDRYDEAIVASRNFTIAPASHATWVITADWMSDNGVQRNT